MRLTVGPLPPAVYWRRRAVVLGSLLLVIFVFYSACSGSGRSDSGRRDTASSPAPTSAAPAGSESPAPDETLLTPEVGPPTTAPATDRPRPEPASQPSAAPADATGGCTDDEMSVTPSPAKASVARNTPIDIRLTITNTSDRTCSRDVGADLQELRIVQGAQTIWSSDHCGALRGSDVRSLVPGDDRQYMVTWNGRSSSKCVSGAPAGPVPAAGAYQILGRLGTKVSAPVTLNLR
jgi:hypothetical protein